MKKDISFLSLPAFNIGAIIFSQIETIGILDEIFKLLLLIATFIYTVVRIYFLFKNKQDKKMLIESIINLKIKRGSTTRIILNKNYRLKNILLN